MYKKSNKIISSTVDLSNYIEGYDLFNSSIIDLLSDVNLEREPYTITSTKEYRPDLISKEIYGSDSYMGILMLTSGIGLENYRAGTIISIIPKLVIDSIIRHI